MTRSGAADGVAGGRQFLLVLSLGLLSALTPLAIDMALPGFLFIETEYGLAPGRAAATISLFLVAFAVGPLVFGPLSDHFGRRPVLLLGLVLFTTGGAVCFGSVGMNSLLAGRVLQGLGAGICSSVAIAIVRDLFVGRRGRAILTLMTLVMGLAPIVAPVLGSVVVNLSGWRQVFLVLCLTGGSLLLFMLASFSESVQAVRANPLTLVRVLDGYRRAANSRIFTGYGLCNGFNFAAMFAFVSSSPTVFMGQFGVSVDVFGGIFALIAAGIIAGAGINSGLLKTGLAPAAVLGASLVVTVLSSLGLLIGGVAGHLNVGWAVALLVLNNTATGLIRPNATHEAMQPLPDIAGSASALFRGGQMLIGAAAVWLLEGLNHEPLVDMALVMSVCAVASVTFFLRTPR